MNKSEYLGLNLPGGTDRYSISSFNQNFTKIDNAVKTITEAVSESKLPVLHIYAMARITMTTTVTEGS